MNALNPTLDTLLHKFSSPEFNITKSFLKNLSQYHKNQQKHSIKRAFLSRLVSLVVCPIFSLFDTLYYLSFSIAYAIKALLVKSSDLNYSNKLMKSSKGFLSNIRYSILDIFVATLACLYDPKEAYVKLYPESRSNNSSSSNSNNNSNSSNNSPTSITLDEVLELEPNQENTPTVE